MSTPAVFSSDATSSSDDASEDHLDYHSNKDEEKQSPDSFSLLMSWSTQQSRSQSGRQDELEYALSTAPSKMRHFFSPILRDDLSDDKIKEHVEQHLAVFIANSFALMDSIAANDAQRVKDCLHRPTGFLNELADQFHITLFPVEMILNAAYLGTTPEIVNIILEAYSSMNDGKRNVMIERHQFSTFTDGCFISALNNPHHHREMVTILLEAFKKNDALDELKSLLKSSFQLIATLTPPGPEIMATIDISFELGGKEFLGELLNYTSPNVELTSLAVCFWYQDREIVRSMLLRLLQIGGKSFLRRLLEDDVDEDDTPRHTPFTVGCQLCGSIAVAQELLACSKIFEFQFLKDQIYKLRKSSRHVHQMCMFMLVPDYDDRIRILGDHVLQRLRDEIQRLTSELEETRKREEAASTKVVKLQSELDEIQKLADELSSPCDFDRDVQREHRTVRLLYDAEIARLQSEREVAEQRSDFDFSQEKFFWEALDRVHGEYQDYMNNRENKDQLPRWRTHFPGSSSSEVVTSQEDAFSPALGSDPSPQTENQSQQETEHESFGDAFTGAERSQTSKSAVSRKRKEIDSTTVVSTYVEDFDDGFESSEHDSSISLATAKTFAPNKNEYELYVEMLERREGHGNHQDYSSVQQQQQGIPNSASTNNDDDDRVTATTYENFHG